MWTKSLRRLSFAKATKVHQLITFQNLLIPKAWPLSSFCFFFTNILGMKSIWKEFRFYLFIFDRTFELNRKSQGSVFNITGRNPSWCFFVENVSLYSRFWPIDFIEAVRNGYGSFFLGNCHFNRLFYLVLF